jgi:GDP-L-fucose synthase
MKRLLITGASGLVGTELVRYFQKYGSFEIFVPRRSELDLRDLPETKRYMRTHRINHVIHLAAKVGGIHANNTYPADFIMENLFINTSVIQAAFDCGIEKLIYLASACVYPANASQPIKESSLLNGTLEPTNEPYAIAKIAGIKMCESMNRQFSTDFRCLIPTNLYGKNDNFADQNSHVIPALMKRFHVAKIEEEPCIHIWGSGKPTRDFMYVEDLVACIYELFNLEKEKIESEVSAQCSHINLGTGTEISISELAHYLKDIVGYRGKIIFDTEKPDGMMRKVLNNEIMLKLVPDLRLTPLADGLKEVYLTFIKEMNK